MIVLALITGFVLRWTRFGRHVFAIGGNEHAATLTGVPVRPIKVAVYMISALSAGIAGIIQTGWLGAVTTNIGTGMELQVIAAAVIGGANLAGGIGTAFGALVGAALIEVIRNSLGLLGINAFWQGTFIGGAIILAVVVRPHPQSSAQRLGQSMHNLFSLAGRRALVTGSGQGIGFGLARGLAEHGATVILNGRTQEKVERAVDTLSAEGHAVHASVFDVTDAASVASAVEKIEAEIGPIDILINNAGMQFRAPLEDFPDDKWQRAAATNVSSVFYVGKAVARHMIPRGRGKIINIASVQSELARPPSRPTPRPRAR